MRYMPTEGGQRRRRRRAPVCEYLLRCRAGDSDGWRSQEVFSAFKAQRAFGIAVLGTGTLTNETTSTPRHHRRRASDQLTARGRVLGLPA